MEEGPAILIKALSLKEVEQIFVITDAIGISREALVIPLRTESPGRMKLMPNGKLEIVVDRDSDFASWLEGLGEQIRSLMNLPVEAED